MLLTAFPIGGKRSAGVIPEELIWFHSCRGGATLFVSLDIYLVLALVLPTVQSAVCRTPNYCWEVKSPIQMLDKCDITQCLKSTKIDQYPNIICKLPLHLGYIRSNMIFFTGPRTTDDNPKPQPSSIF